MKDPMRFIGTMAPDAFLELVRRHRITPKEIRKWFQAAKHLPPSP